ncbi:MAG TPA: efflux transporter outer membrane subunit [Chthoniobacterales bacterium]|jgi:NodT family efflux transporter outer membrane factor (OMF) lipoprotein|nr:efflux transporter outer membrane subunit [Candidatus Udaeobacter sp.]HEV3393781.1 efflux transporter outer membrane subunit [Chthoniobacterales bacterium]
MKTNFQFAIVAFGALLCLAACVVGPNFKKPAAPDVEGYTSAPLSTTESTAKVAGGEAQHFIKDIDIPGEWWALFHSKPLNDLIERSLKINPDIKAALAALLVARENVLAQKGAFYPTVTGSFSATRSKTSKELSPATASGALYYSLYTPRVNVSYVPDVFGLNRRTVESLQAQAEQARFALAAAHITLSTNVAAAAIQEASLRAQIDAARQLIAINSNLVQVVRNQLAKHAATNADLASQESQLAQINATLPPLLKQLAQQRDLLAALSGGLPSKDFTEQFELLNLQLPQKLPLSLPSRLVEQRPDVRQAEENLHSASAQVGVAVANRLPNFNLTADAGTMALTASKIFSGGAGFWDLGASVTQPIFQGGTLLHKQRAARAAYVQAAEQYRGTVLTAFQNVADTLSALQHDADALKATAAAADAARVTLELTRRQVETGAHSEATQLALLNAEQTYQQATINRIQAQANRYADTAVLFHSLGGGWWNRADLVQND